MRAHFTTLLSDKGFSADPAQQLAIDRLGQWLSAFLASRTRWSAKPVAGVYLWGGVGRGKSFVMDAFFAAAPLQDKRRVHFHAFLQELQQRMLAYNGQPDPLARVAGDIAKRVRLLCFDEFHVHDIGDAILLGRLLKVLVEKGVGVVCTSNYAPQGLCPNPLYRERFKPAISLLEQRFAVVQLDGGADYRQRAAYCWGEYIWPVEASSDVLGKRLGLGDSAEYDCATSLNHHPLRLRAREAGMLWLDFSELCRKPRSSADFLWLCDQYRQLAVTGVPCLDAEGIDVQQRFLNFIDIAYDSGVQLLLGCEASLDELCLAGSHVDFSRTRSRLQQLSQLKY
ncbi:cell division protein ZapE [Pseudomonas segetis]|uniref:Cell division protein ZapE n=1 Tax=Pseudomonas segetis TaxID=298908 RepID=A0A239AAY5_9PSED|nr:cell division protein ZapE [Pseudomonas segetis]SNR92795.1 cell division protein ZapE [Pseudomonas segetis]